MGEEFIENGIRLSVRQIVSAKIQQEIDKKVEEFKRELEDRKDNYIAEIMKGIRIYHERETQNMETNYRIIFENVTRLEKK